MNRRKTKTLKIGNVTIGGDSPIAVQTMVKQDAHDIDAVVKEIHESEKVGCDITRMGVLDMASVKNFGKIIEQINIPIVADIHFNYKFAIEAISQGVQKLRINPGNIGGIKKVKEVVAAAKEREIPIRIGVNAGSLEKDLLEKYGGHPTPEAMVESSERHIQILEDLNYDKICVSLKASDVRLMVKAYEIFSEKYDYPLHVGVTEAGPIRSSLIKSSIGVGYLLLKGIGDTIRVSATTAPFEEVKIGKEILKHLGLNNTSPILISCPMCSRTEFEMGPITEKIENYLEQYEGKLKKPIQVAVMGCIVNGPGEAREADVGVAGGKGKGILFVKGEVIKEIKEDDMYDVLVEKIEEIIEKQ